MVSLDINKTNRNKKIKDLQSRRRAMQPEVFKELYDFEGGKYCNEASLNAFIGGKFDEYITSLDASFISFEDLKNRWMSGLSKAAHASQASGCDLRHQRMACLINGDYPFFNKYVLLFLEGYFLRYCDNMTLEP